MTTKYYRIGGHLISLSGEITSDRMIPIKGFSVFECGCPDNETPELTIETDRTVPDVQGVLFDEGTIEDLGTFAIYRFGEGFECRFYTPTEGEIFHLVCYPQQGRVIADTAKHFFALRFGLWLSYNMAFACRNTIAIHSSVICHRGQAVMVLGESGTGKSTHTRLWRENIGGTTLLNDDSPMIRIIEGRAMVYGSPWSGKTPCYRNEVYPLAGIIRIRQAPYNKIRRLPALEALGAVYPSCPPELTPDAVLAEGICETLSVMLRETPVFLMECLPDSEAAQMSFRAIFNS